MLVPRENYINAIRPFYDVDLVKVIMGSRRAGKSKLIELIIDDLKMTGIHDEDILYMNFEDLEFDEIDDYRKLNNYVKELKRIYKYDISGMRALKYNPKIYAVDNGFRFIKLNGNGIDSGRFLENLVCIELLARGYEVYVGKTYKGEIDFVVIKNGKKCFIQVAYMMTDENTVEREFGAFSPIKDASPKYVMSLDRIDMSRKGITHLNVIDFLLGKRELYLS